MPPNKRRRNATSTAPSRPVAAGASSSAAVDPANAARLPHEASLLFWVREAVRAPPPPDDALHAGKRRRSRSTGATPQPDATAAERKEAVAEVAVAEGPVVSATSPGGTEAPARAGEEQRAGETPPRTGITARDVMPFFDHLLEGQLGPVAIDVHIHGETSLLRDPAAFQRALASAEQASTGPLQILLCSVKPFLFTRGGGLYTVDNSVYPVLPTLASLVMAPKVQKIVANAALLYRLLFLFLGTDRVAVANVVDIGTWCTVLRQSGAASHAQRQRLLPATASDVLVGVSHMFAQLPAEAKSQLVAQASSVTVAPPPPPPSARLPSGVDAERPSRRGTAWEASDTEGGRLTPPLHSASVASPVLALQPIPTPEDVERQEEADEEDVTAFVERVLTRNTQNDKRPRREGTRLEEQQQQHKQWANSVASRGLARIFTDLGTAFFYYDRLMQPLQHVAASGSAEPISNARSREGPRVLADVCASRVYAVFLCAQMSFHGVFVSTTRYEQMKDHLTEQVAELAEAAMRTIDKLHAMARHVEKLVFTSSTTASQLLSYVQQVMQGQTGLQGEAGRLPAGTATMGSLTTQRETVCRTLGVVSSANLTNLTEGEQAIAVNTAQLLRIWLATQERVSYRDGPLHRLFRDLGDHLRVSVQVGDGAALPSAAYSVHPMWSLHGHSTGRIFAAMPNLQTIPADPPRAAYCFTTLTQTTPGPPVLGQLRGAREVERRAAVSAGTTTPLLFHDHPQWTLRRLYTPPAGCTMVSLDFNQIELRVLAHLSRDEELIAGLSDDTSDVLSRVARLVYRHDDVAQVTPEQRQAMKVVVYGLVYGMGPDLLDERLRKIYAPQMAAPESAEDAQNGANSPRPPDARELTTALYAAFPAMHAYLRDCRLRATHAMQAETLSGVKDLSEETDVNRRRQRAVSWAVQGGAADILHAAMRAVHQCRHQLLPFFPAAPVALLMTVHDELIYAVPTAAVDVVVPQLKTILESQGAPFGLRVPLRVSVKVGASLGELTPYGHGWRP